LQCGGYKILQESTFVDEKNRWREGTGAGPSAFLMKIILAAKKGGE
jgi:hypothetical protein